MKYASQLTAAALAVALCIGIAGCALADPDVKAAQDSIGSIGEVSLESHDTIAAARASYDTLTDEQKTKVSNARELDDAEQAWQEKYGSRIGEAEEAISAIGTVALDSEAAIDQAATAYHALSTDEKVYVSNRNDLSAAQNTLAKLKKEEAAKPKPFAVGDAADNQKWHVALTAAYTAEEVTDPTALDLFRAEDGCFLVMEFDVRGTEGCRETIDEKIITDIAATYNGQTYKKFDYQAGGFAIFTSARNTIFDWDGTSSVHLYVFTQLPADALGQHADVTLKILGENKEIGVN